MAGRPKKQAAKRTRRKGERIPWQEIEDRWVQGGDDVTHRSLAEEFGLRPQRIGQRASAYHWSVKRLAYRSRLRQAVSEKVFKDKVAIGVEARMLLIEDRFEHLKALRGLRESGVATKLMKTKAGDSDEVHEYETSWTTSDHVNYRKVMDEAEAGILRALGVEGFEFGSDPRVPAYIPTAYLEMMLEQRKKQQQEDEDDDSSSA